MKNIIFLIFTLFSCSSTQEKNLLFLESKFNANWDNKVTIDEDGTFFYTLEHETEYEEYRMNKYGLEYYHISKGLHAMNKCRIYKYKINSSNNSELLNNLDQKTELGLIEYDNNTRTFYYIYQGEIIKKIKFSAYDSEYSEVVESSSLGDHHYLVRSKRPLIDIKETNISPQRFLMNLKFPIKTMHYNASFFEGRNTFERYTYTENSAISEKIYLNQSVYSWSDTVSKMIIPNTNTIFSISTEIKVLNDTIYELKTSSAKPGVTDTLDVWYIH